MTEEHSPSVNETDDMVAEHSEHHVVTGAPSSEQVGYGHPPKAHQFKPGQSGNPKGRPEGSSRFKTRLANALAEPTPTPNGRAAGIEELIVHCVKKNLIKGNMSAVPVALDLLENFPLPGEENAAEELDPVRKQKLLEAQERLSSTSEQSAPAKSATPPQTLSEDASTPHGDQDHSPEED